MLNGEIKINSLQVKPSFKINRKMNHFFVQFFNIDNLQTKKGSQCSLMLF